MHGSACAIQLICRHTSRVCPDANRTYIHAHKTRIHSLALSEQQSEIHPAIRKGAATHRSRWHVTLMN